MDVNVDKETIRKSQYTEHQYKLRETKHIAAYEMNLQ